MSNPAIIPTNFTVPEDCRHEYLIFWNQHHTGSIRGIPGRRQIAFETRHFPCTKAQAAVFNNFSFDWLRQSIEHLRFICKG